MEKSLQAELPTNGTGDDSPNAEHVIQQQDQRMSRRRSSQLSADSSNAGPKLNMQACGSRLHRKRSSQLSADSNDVGYGAAAVPDCGHDDGQPAHLGWLKSDPSMRATYMSDGSADLPAGKAATEGVDLLSLTSDAQATAEPETEDMCEVLTSTFGNSQESSSVVQVR